MDNKISVLIEVEYHDRKTLDHHIKGPDYHHAFYEIADKVFRPARKHGYNDLKINEALDKCGDHGEELVGLLEEMFHEVLREEEVNL